MPLQPPLTGLRVFEMTNYIAGPYCGSILADYGAECIKIEEPSSGDRGRATNPLISDDPQISGFFYTLDFENHPALTHKIWWPATEAIGAAAFLNALKPDPFYEDWYRKVWDFSANRFITRFIRFANRSLTRNNCFPSADFGGLSGL